MKFYNRYNHEVGKTHDFSNANPKAESVTLQCHKDSADVNLIIKKYTLTGEAPSNLLNEATIQYLDTTIFPDFQTAMDSVNSVKSSFLALPSNVRKAFNNDPAELYNAFMSGERDDELIHFGLKEKVKPKAPTDGVSLAVDDVKKVSATEGVGTITP